MNLRDYAKSYTVEDGALAGMTFWLLPFRPALADLDTMELERAEPQFAYVHTDGRRQTDEPNDLKAERERVEKARRVVLERAKAMKVKPNAAKLAKLVVASDWERVRVWGLLHDTFCHILLLVVAIDFPDDEAALSSEARIFADFWTHQPTKLLERWALFQQVAGVNVVNSLWAAYAETRDTTASAPPELGQEEPGEDADPKSSSNTGT